MIAFCRVFTHSEQHAREYVARAVQLIERLADGKFPIRRIIFAVWKGNVNSDIPGDAGFFVPLMVEEMKKRPPRIPVEISDNLRARDPYRLLLNEGLGFAAQRGADYLMPISLQAIDYLSTDVSDGFIEAMLAGAVSVGLSMSEVEHLTGPSNRLAMHAIGPLCGIGGFGTSINLRGMGLSAVSSVWSSQEQILAALNAGRAYGEGCVHMVESLKQGLYHDLTSPDEKRVHDAVAGRSRDQEKLWLKFANASEDELLSVIRH